MTDHSPEAIAAYPATDESHPLAVTLALRTAFDRGVASKHLIDRETLAQTLHDADYGVGRVKHSAHAARFYAMADAVLASPSLSLVAVRDEAAIRQSIYEDVRAIPAWGNSESDGFDVGDMPRAEVLRVIRNDPEPPRAARIRSGKAEA